MPIWITINYEVSAVANQAEVIFWTLCGLSAIRNTCSDGESNRVSSDAEIGLRPRCELGGH
jgi:hypothetical protein